MAPGSIRHMLFFKRVRFDPNRNIAIIFGLELLNTIFPALKKNRLGRLVDEVLFVQDAIVCLHAKY